VVAGVSSGQSLHPSGCVQLCLSRQSSNVIGEHDVNLNISGPHRR